MADEIYKSDDIYRPAAPTGGSAQPIANDGAQPGTYAQGNSSAPAQGGSAAPTQGNSSAPAPRKKSPVGTIILIALGILVIGTIVYSAYLLRDTVVNGADNLKDSYTLTKDEIIQEKENEYYLTWYDIAEEKYHIKTVANINVIDEQEISRLEVMKVSDVFYLTENNDDNDVNVIYWVKYTTTGTFFIDMMQAEYIVDDRHNTVTVRVPEPKVDNFNISDEILLNKVVGLNGNYSEGNDYAEAKRQEAYATIIENIRNNQEFILTAKRQTELIISNWIYELNPERDDLQVILEFVK